MANRAFDIVPSLKVQNTDAQVLDQGYTYNQTSLTYNQIGVDYAGVYQIGEDIVPIISMAKDFIPTIYNYLDIYQGPPPPNFQKTVGPGWWMYVSQ